MVELAFEADCPTATSDSTLAGHFLFPFLLPSRAVSVNRESIMDRIESLAGQLSQITMYDVKSMYNQVRIHPCSARQC